MRKRTRGRWLAAVLAASAALVSGCSGSVDPAELPGVYRDEETGGELRLESDGTFSATAVSTDGSSRPGDFSGQWEYVDSETSSDFIMLDIKDGGLRKVTGVQLYPSGREAVEFRPDPDGPPSLELTKAAAP
jgi:major membrane immunogen (membrane-anchored lipoprotein)